MNILFFLIIIILLLVALICCFIYIGKTQKILRAIPRRDPGRSVISTPSAFCKDPDRILDDLNYLVTEAQKPDQPDRERELLETKMQFAQLQNQINPHFLYNTLENIRARAILDDNTVIADMTEALSRFFRYNISKRSDVVKLSDELDNIRTYVQIQQYRFSNKFDFQIFIHDEDREVMHAMIPKMTLQPIVENAIFHGMENKIGKGHIEIHIESDETHVYVIVEDDGAGMTEDKLDSLMKKLSISNAEAAGKSSHGIAMININRRLRLFFGEEYGITVSSTEGVGTEVELRLPRKMEGI